MSEAVKAIVIKITDDGIYIDAQRGKTNKYKPEHRAGSPSAALEKVGELLGLAPLKTCPRCTKRIAGEGVHTCTPTERWRVLELAIEDLMRDKYRLMRQRGAALVALEATKQKLWSATECQQYAVQYLLSEVREIVDDALANIKNKEKS